MRTITALVAAIIAISNPTRHADAQGWASVLQGLPISELTKQLGQGVAYLVDQHKDANARQRSDSLGQLVIDLADLAGSENSLADLIDELVANPGIARGGYGVMNVLNDHLNLIRQKFIKLNTDLRNLSPQWAQNNPSLPIDIGSVAHDGALFYCIKACGTDIYRGGPAIQLTEPKETVQLAAVLRSDVGKIRKIADAIRIANAQSQPMK